MEASGVRTYGMHPRGFLGTRESRPPSRHAWRDNGEQASQSKNLVMGGRKSDWLIVLGGRESRLHGEGASSCGLVLRQHGLYATEAWGLHTMEGDTLPCQRDWNE